MTLDFMGLSAPLMEGEPGAAGGGADLGAAVDSLLASPSAASTEPAAAEPAPADGTSTDGQEQISAESAPVTAEGSEAEVDETPFDDENDEDLDQAMADQAKPNLLDLKQPRGKRIYGAYKAYKGITEALGFEPTTEAVKSHFESYSDKLAMETEFTAGDPVQSANFLQHWNNVSPQGMESAAAVLPDVLATQNQQAYQAMAVPVLKRYVGALYNRAAAETNPELKQALLYTARMTDWDLFGSFRKEDAPAPDPNADREAAINTKLGQIKQFETRQLQAAAQQWNTDLQNTNGSALEGAVDQALKPLSKVLPGRVFNATKADFIRDVLQHMAKDVEGQRLYDIQRNRAARSREGLEALSSAFMQRASRAIRVLAPVFLKEAGVVAKTQSDTRHAALAGAAAAGKAPTSAGTPVAQSITPQNRQYGSKAEKMDADIDALLGRGARR